MKSVKNIFSFILVCTLLKCIKGGCPANSKAVLRNHQKLCIELYKERVSWYKAKRKCIAKGQNLLEINSERENRYISRLFPNFGNAVDRGTWIGGENHADHNQWVWSEYGKSISCDLMKNHTGDSRICSGSFEDSFAEYDNFKTRCLNFDRNNLQWSLSSCSEKRYYFCEYLQDLDPELGEKELQLPNEGAFVELTHKLVDHDPAYTVEINLEFSTYSERALILWQGSRNDLDSKGEFIAIAITNGHPVLNVGDHQISVYKKVNDGEVHSIKVIKSKTEITLIVDENQKKSREYVNLDGKEISRHSVFLGGNVHTGGLYEHGFVGCIHYLGVQNHCTDEDDATCLEFGQEPLDFADDAIVLQYTGSKSMKQCILVESTTLPTLTSHPYPRRPPVFGLSLDGTGFAKMDDTDFLLNIGDEDFGDGLLLEFVITTIFPEGLLFSLGGTDDTSGRYLVLKIEAGMAVVEWSFGDVTDRLETKNRVDNGQPVNITLKITNDQIYLKSNKFGRVENIFTQNFNGPVFVGGIPGSSYAKNNGFIGCLNSLHVSGINGASKMINFGVDATEVKGDMLDQECKVDPQPMTTASTTSSSTTSTTSSTTTMTTSASTTSSTTTTTTAAPYKPSRPPSYGLQGNGSGYGEIWDEKIISYEDSFVEFNILITTIHSEGIIFFQGTWAGDGFFPGSFLAIGIKDGLPTVDWSFGADEIKTITSRKQIDDGKPISIILSIRPGNAGNMTLSVGGYLTIGYIEGDSPPNGPIYIAGLPRGHNMKEWKYQNGFNGCLNSFKVSALTGSQYINFNQEVTENTGVGVLNDQCRSTPSYMTKPPTTTTATTTETTTFRPPVYGFSVDGSGYAEMPAALFGIGENMIVDDTKLDIQFLVTTVKSKGLLFLIGFENQHFLAIEIVTGAVSVRWNFGNESQILQTRNRIDDGQPTNITLKITNNVVLLNSRGSERSKSMILNHFPDGPIHVGGSRTADGFKGCINSLHITRRGVTTMVNIERESINVVGNIEDDECKVEARPMSTPKSIPTTSKPQITTVTSSQPVFGLSLDGDGFANMKDDDFILDVSEYDDGGRSENINLILDFTLTTIDSEGLLLWIGTFDNFRGGKFLSISIEDGVAVVEWDFGIGTKRIKTRSKINDGQPSNITLTVSSEKVNLRSRGLQRSKLIEGNIFPSTPVFIGGAPNIRDKTGGRHSHGFRGCLNTLYITDMIGSKRMINFAKDPTRVVGDNKNEACMVVPQAMSTTTTTTPTTTSTSTAKNTTTRPATTTTIPEAKECMHPTLSFSGNGYFELTQKLMTYKADATIEIDLHITTNARDGLLLWKKSERYQDYIAIGLKNGYVFFEYRYTALALTVTINSETQVNDGTLHKIKATKNTGGSATLKIDQNRPLSMSVDLRGGKDQLNTRSASLFIGGLPKDIGLITGGLYSEGFSGCIHYLKVYNTLPNINYGGNSLKDEFFKTGSPYVESYAGVDCNKVCPREKKRNMETFGGISSRESVRTIEDDETARTSARTAQQQATIGQELATGEAEQTANWFGW